MKNILFGAALLASLPLFAVGGARKQQATLPEHRMADMSLMMQNCPMKVGDVALSAVDTKDGIALTITTKSGDVAELRRRTENMAKMHSASSNAGMHGEMMPFSIKYEEVANGARLMLTPKEPAQLDAFRTKVRQHAEQMKKGECSMMQGMMDGMKNPQAKPKPEEEDHSAHRRGRGSRRRADAPSNSGQVRRSRGRNC